ncbi:E2 ubiquitin-conjugating enzyme [Ranunculus cassubicifolius]
MSTQASLLLQKQLKELNKNPVSGFSAGLVDDTNVFEWSVTIMVYPDGKVCISILHEPGDDPNGYEHSSERWNPVHTVESIVLSIISMLSSPNDESPANVDAALCTLKNNNKKIFKVVYPRE